MLAPRTLGIILIVGAILLGGILFTLKSNTDEQGLALCQLYTEDGRSMAECPAHDDAISWYFIIAFGITAVALGTGVYLTWFYKRNKQSDSVPESNRPTFDATTLEGDERLVWEKIVEGNGSLFQSDLIKTTQFSKVKLSRVLDRLESKGAIERKRRGMANLVVAK